MKIEIKKVQETEEIIVKFRSEKISISKNSPDWTNEGICKFLINLAVNIPEEEKLEIIFDSDSKDEVYKHICTLFQIFADQYNIKLK